MTPEETKAAAAVMLAYAEGKAIESRIKGEQRWVDCHQPFWKFDCNEYRVKCEPWSGKIWVHENGVSGYLYAERQSKDAFLTQGYRLIEVKEVTA